MVRRRLTVAPDAHVAGGDAPHPPVGVVEHLGGGEAGIDLGPRRFRLGAQPAGQVGQADHVIAMIVHLRRRRQAERTLLRQEQKMILGGRRVERRALFLPIWDEFVQGTRIDNRSRQDMGADFGTLLDDADANIAPLFRRNPPQPNGRGEPGHAGANDDHVVLHRFPFSHDSGVPICVDPSLRWPGL